MNNKNCAKIYAKLYQYKIDLCFKIEKTLFNTLNHFGIQITFCIFNKYSFKEQYGKEN